MTHSLSERATRLMSSTRYRVDAIRQCPIPHLPGIYGWWFSTLPPQLVAVDGWEQTEGRLLYVGIAPNSPSSASTLHKRLIRDHCGNRIASSTLRRKLAVLLQDQLSLRICRCKHSGKLCMSKSDEQRLTAWMEKAARVAWSVDGLPWEVEKEVLASIRPPLNTLGIDGGDPDEDLRRFSAILKDLLASVDCICLLKCCRRHELEPDSA
jgi:hypothetical protein